MRFVFPFNALVKAHGIGRMRLIALEPEIKLYLSPIQFDPSSLPPFPPRRSSRSSTCGRSPPCSPAGST